MISDAHLDLGMDLLKCRRSGETRVMEGYYLPEWRSSGVGLIVAAIYLSRMDSDEAYFREAMAQIDALDLELASLNGEVVLCTGGEQIRQVRQAGKIALLLSLEGAEPIGKDPARLDEFYARGVRLLGMTWSRKNHAGFGAGYAPGGSTDHLGLTPMGKELVRRADTLGVLIDVSHLNQGGCDDVAALVTRPFFASHSNPRALRPMDRNLSDRTIAAIAASGGVIGANGYSGLVADPEQATVAALADHIEYLCRHAGSDRVGLGLDLMIRISGGSDTFTYQGVTVDAFDILPDHGAMDHLRRELAGRGWSASDIAAVVGENWFDFFSKNL